MAVPDGTLSAFASCRKEREWTDRRVGFHRAPQAGIDCESAASVSAGGLAACLRQEVQQTGVIFVNVGQRVFDIPKGGVQDQLHDAALLVFEERGQRIVHVAVVAIERRMTSGKSARCTCSAACAANALELLSIALLIRF